MNCPKCKNILRHKMTGAVCDNYPCNYSTRDFKHQSQSIADDDGNYTISLKDDHGNLFIRNMNSFKKY